MSMDLEVWGSRAFDPSRVLDSLGTWVAYPRQYAHEADGWQVLVTPEPFDHSVVPPPRVTAALPNPVCRLGVTLEPIGADDDGCRFLERVTRHLAAELGGIWVDPSGNVFGPSEGSFV